MEAAGLHAGREKQESRALFRPVDQAAKRRGFAAMQGPVAGVVRLGRGPTGDLRVLGGQST